MIWLPLLIIGCMINLNPICVISSKQRFFSHNLNAVKPLKPTNWTMLSLLCVGHFLLVTLWLSFIGVRVEVLVYTSMAIFISVLTIFGNTVFIKWSKWKETVVTALSQYKLWMFCVPALSPIPHYFLSKLRSYICFRDVEGAHVFASVCVTIYKEDISKAYGWIFIKLAVNYHHQVVLPESDDLEFTWKSA